MNPEKDKYLREPKVLTNGITIRSVGSPNFEDEHAVQLAGYHGNIWLNVKEVRELVKYLNKFLTVVDTKDTKDPEVKKGVARIRG